MLSLSVHAQKPPSYEISWPDKSINEIDDNAVKEGRQDREVEDEQGIFIHIERTGYDSDYTSRASFVRTGTAAESQSVENHMLTASGTFDVPSPPIHQA